MNRITIRTALSFSVLITRILIGLHILSVLLIRNAYAQTDNKVFHLDGRSIRGLAYDSGVLWAIHSPVDFGNAVKISRINPDNGQILLESSQFPSNGRGITVGAGFLWIADAKADVIWKIDPANFNQIASFRTPGSEPCGIAFDGTNLWLVDPYFQKIYRLSTSGDVISSFTVPNEFRSAMEWDNTGIWTNTDNNKVSYYTTSGSITSTITLNVLPAGLGFMTSLLEVVKSTYLVVTKSMFKTGLLLSSRKRHSDNR